MITGDLLYELAESGGPELKFYDPRGTVHAKNTPPTIAKDMHNSIHPLWLPELKGYLGVGHRHYASGSDPLTGEWVRGRPFRFGYVRQQASRAPRRHLLSVGKCRT